jgi:ligand-binding SRPBCC domain-containing protein
MQTNIMSKVYNLKKVQELPTTLERAWDFFSSPENLKTITPPHLGFQILSEEFGEKMFAGQLIEFTVKPFWAFQYTG